MYSKAIISFTSVISVFAVLSMASVYSFAHEAHHPAPHTQENKEVDLPALEKQIFAQINLNYEKEIKPIFRSKCMNCHSSQTNYPAYSNWPIVKKIIDDDIAESKKHIDMTNGFPFAGHGTPTEDLEALKKAALNGSMPPLRYRIMHWQSGLTDTERKAISTWVDESLDLLKK